MKIQSAQKAPLFTTQDVKGNTIKLADFKGKKVLLSFHRNVGCPVCNLRFHTLKQNAAYFEANNLVMLHIYESSAEKMKEYLNGEENETIMIPNPSQDLYKLYAVERSMLKFLKGLFSGALAKVKQGTKLFKNKIKQDGNLDRIGADFLIDEDGKVQIAYYGKYLGDNLPLEEIKKAL